MPALRVTLCRCLYVRTPVRVIGCASLHHLPPVQLSACKKELLEDKPPATMPAIGPHCPYSALAIERHTKGPASCKARERPVTALYGHKKRPCAGLMGLSCKADTPLLIFAAVRAPLVSGLLLEGLRGSASPLAYALCCSSTMRV